MSDKIKLSETSFKNRTVLQQPVINSTSYVTHFYYKKISKVVLWWTSCVEYRAHSNVLVILFRKWKL